MTPRITPERATELLALSDAAIKPPWRGAGTPGPGFEITVLVGGKWDGPAQDLAAAARQAVPDLIADLTDARAEIERLRAQVEADSDIAYAARTERDAAVAKVERVEQVAAGLDDLYLAPVDASQIIAAKLRAALAGES